MANCLDCKNCLVCRDPDPIDSFNYDDMAAVCTISKEKGQLCKELSYLMPLEYDSLFKDSPCAENPWITVSARPYQLRKECEIPYWCPLNGTPNSGTHQETMDTAIEIMKKIRS